MNDSFLNSILKSYTRVLQDLSEIKEILAKKDTETIVPNANTNRSKCYECLKLQKKAVPESTIKKRKSVGQKIMESSILAKERKRYSDIVDDRQISKNSANLFNFQHNQDKFMFARENSCIDNIIKEPNFIHNLTDNSLNQNENVSICKTDFTEDKEKIKNSNEIKIDEYKHSLKGNVAENKNNTISPVNYLKSDFTDKFELVNEIKFSDSNSVTQKLVNSELKQEPFVENLISTIKKPKIVKKKVVKKTVKNPQQNSRKNSTKNDTESIIENRTIIVDNKQKEEIDDFMKEIQEDINRK